ncbi:D-Ala-D-Ala carboxypeptidase family metallohydrolase [Novosphingobium pentaromativorans]|uniref:Peptidase M15A C-terminal domain-containing protein n=1 Tax=Novosphingobium pentaromativorans US6-1 TaxID=1088721 RepID=G6EFI7_9SPHN|nr:D-Ala-D-Ala carboxypeptidase family metallohydrolase [Novosphingobium pentaromativorans]AIT79100.1 hypothetical protein JI59_04410 [Novosphingobium pentaromativorans US6-1]EHJ59935.1 hypothetical protein NSU_3108 [Novosphingobium pentaromativorans US6-1]
MQLSKHFTLEEMVRSQTAERLGIDNTPSQEIVANLRGLCAHVLEPVRAHFNSPVIVSSGYRCPQLNVAIGGSKSSQHCKGEAGDFSVLGQPNITVFKWIWHNLDYDQLIYEFGESGWIHASFSANRMRNMELTAVRRGGRVQYLPGLVA